MPVDLSPILPPRASVDVISGTGSRSLIKESAAVRREVVDFLVAAIGQMVPMKVIAGGAEGFDEILALATLEAGFPLTLALPSPDYGSWYWHKKTVHGFSRIDVFDAYLERADEVIYVCDSHQYGKANFIRNQWMVDRAEYFFVYDSTSAGTAHCVKLLDKKKTPYFKVKEYLNV